MRRVRLLGVPAAEFIRLQRWVDDLLREMEIIEVGLTAGATAFPAEAREVMRSLLDHYADARSAAREQAEAASRSGLAFLDVDLDLPVEAADDAARLVELFERADELARAGLLLSVAPAPDVVALRRWTAAELWRQLREGLPPLPYPTA